MTAWNSGGNLLLRNIRFSEVGLPTQEVLGVTLTLKEIFTLHTEAIVTLGHITVYPARMECCGTFYSTPARDLFVYQIYVASLNVFDLTMDQWYVLAERSEELCDNMYVWNWGSNAD